MFSASIIQKKARSGVPEAETFSSRSAWFRAPRLDAAGKGGNLIAVDLELVVEPLVHDNVEVDIELVVIHIGIEFDVVPTN